MKDKLIDSFVPGKYETFVPEQETDFYCPVVDKTITFNGTKCKQVCTDITEPPEAVKIKENCLQMTDAEKHLLKFRKSSEKFDKKR